MRTRHRWRNGLRLLLPTGLLLCVAAPSAAQVPMTLQGEHGWRAGDEQVARARHLLSRATWGVRPADLDAVLAAGTDTWLQRQLQPASIPDDLAAARLAAFPTTTLAMSALYRDFSPRPEQLRELQQMQAMRDSLGDARMLEQMTPERRRELQERNPARLLNELVGAKIQRAIHSERQLEDVMTDFWFNHFSVFFGKNQVRYLIADYERSAIRPHVFGRFEDMLLATAQHPAMLFYLDNWTSVHVDPGVAGALPERARTRGLNENYARELLELHTLGVDGGYTQQDVVEVARAFTGWSFLPYNEEAQRRPVMQALRQRQARGGPQARWVVGEGDVPFVFRPELHDRAEKHVLGTRLPAGRGLEDGRDVIGMLSRHPSTARHLATKLVERFVSDDPPAELVEHIADVFLRSHGDLRAVTHALFTADAFYSPEHIGAKVKTPYELVVSALRVTHADVATPVRLSATLRAMGHLPYTEPAPTGFPAMSEDWVNTGAMLSRMNFALELAGGRVQGVRVNGAALLRGAPGVDPLLAAVLPAVDTGRLAERIRGDGEAQGGAPPRERLTRALGLALGSPDFQRR
jgi:uncharacterized protein (DUF1800 family)